MSGSGRDRLRKPELEQDGGGRSELRARRGAVREPTILHLQRTAGNRAANGLLRAAPLDDVRPLRPEIRERIEARLGADLSRARVHMGPEAAGEARREGALAFTRGNDIFLGETVQPDDLRVLSHEAAHVLQQTRPGVRRPPSALEAEAEAVGLGATTPLGSAPFGAVQKQTREQHLREELDRNWPAWKRHIDDPETREILRNLPPFAYEHDEEFKKWMKDPRYRPQGWEPPSPVAPVDARAPDPRGSAAAGAPGVSGETVTVKAPNVAVSYDDKANRYVVAVDGNPIAAVEADKNTPLKIDVQTSGDRLGLNVTGGPHRVVPLGTEAHGPGTVPLVGQALADVQQASAAGEGGQESESTGFTRSEVEPLLVKGAPRPKTQEELFKENWAKNTTPSQKKEAAELPPPSIYYSKEMRELDAPPEIFEAADMFLPFPAFTTGWKAGQIIPTPFYPSGETISGMPVDRAQVAQEIAESVVTAVILDKAGDEVLGRLLPEDEVIETALRRGDDLVDDAVRKSATLGGAPPHPVSDVPRASTREAPQLGPGNPSDLAPQLPAGQPQVIPPARQLPAGEPQVIPPARQLQAGEPQVIPPARQLPSGDVWVNPKSRGKVYHQPGSPFYGTTKEGMFMPEAEAQRAGYRAAKTGSEAAQRGTAEHTMIKEAQRPSEAGPSALVRPPNPKDEWTLALVERTVGGKKRVDELWINHGKKKVFVGDTYTGPVESPAHEQKGFSYAKEPDVKALLDQGYEYEYRAGIKHPEKLH
jgi:hypothetical protein